MPRLLTLLIACCLVLPLAACNDKDDPTGPEPPITVEPRTPDGLIADFRAAYAARDLAAYRDGVLAPAYRFPVQAATVEELSLPDSTLLFADDVAIAEAMFTGQPNLDGEVLTGITIDTLQPQGGWIPVPAGDPYFGGVAGAQVRTYTLLFYFELQNDGRYEVSGLQFFYVVPETLMSDGRPVVRHRLLGQIDLTGDDAKAVDNLSWSDVKAQWW